MLDSELIDDYISSHISSEPEWLAQTYRDTWQHRLYPRMCSGNIQGAILTMLASMARPRRVIELGTFSGYSAMALAAGMPDGGELHTIEIDDEHEEFILHQIERSPYAKMIHLHIGDALSIIPSLDCQEWDMAYIDANKRSYSEYYELLLPRMRQGGFILADNTLWDGKAADPDAKSDPQLEGIRMFNDLVAGDPRVTAAILPIRDGLTLLRVN